MNKYGQFNFIAAGVCFAGTIVSVMQSSVWLFFLNAFFCGINIYAGYFLIKRFDKN